MNPSSISNRYLVPRLVCIEISEYYTIPHGFVGVNMNPRKD